MGFSNNDFAGHLSQAEFMTGCLHTIQNSYAPMRDSKSWISAKESKPLNPLSIFLYAVGALFEEVRD